ncbi:MAG: CRISPR-associated helicase Cas3' [Oscillospiraceae bacterium]|nr:CRISPR-associated helicase Cas3' [Oscillospiraceae bacterium]
MEYLAHLRGDGVGQSVKEHLDGVSALAGRMAGEFGASDFAAAVGSVHDAGKYSEAFQRRIRGGAVKVDHSTAGGQLLVESSGNSQVPERPLQLAAYCVLGHHSGLPDGINYDDITDKKTLKKRLTKTVDDYGAFNLENEVPKLQLPSGIKFSDTYSGAFFVRMVFSALVDADWTDTESFISGGADTEPGKREPRPALSSIAELKSRFFESIESYINPADAPPPECADGASVGKQTLMHSRNLLLRECIAAANSDPGLFTLTAPTGSGKTIAGMAFALAHAAKFGKRRVIYVAPYNTIIEQNADEYNLRLGNENVLQHYTTAGYGDSMSEDDERSRRNTPAVENWDSPIIATSAVQFFESLFAFKPSACRKLHNIANSVIIFDEAQALPIGKLIPCVRAMGELVRNYGCTIVLATATQNALDKFFSCGKNNALGIPATEIVSDPHELYLRLKRARIETIPGKLTDEELALRLSEHESVLCIVNTRRHAQKLVEALKKRCSESSLEDTSNGVFHLSTTMYPKHRVRVLDEIRKRLKAGDVCRVVSTSLVEAGVDLDFDTVYRAMAGSDSIVQAAGRCNREWLHDASDSVVYVFESDEHTPPRSIVPNIRAAEQTAGKFDDLASPEAIYCYFEQLYANKGNDRLDDQKIMKKLEGVGVMFPFRHLTLQLIEDVTVPIYVLYNEPGAGEAAAEDTGEPPAELEASAMTETQKLEKRLREGERSRDLFRRLGRYAVSLYSAERTNLCIVGAAEKLDEDVYLLTQNYYKEYGVELTPTGGDGLFL